MKRDTKGKKSCLGMLLRALLIVAVALAVLVGVLYCIMFPHVDYDTGIDWDALEGENVTLQYPIFDGTTVWENATVVIENGVIADVAVSDGSVGDSRYFLMPGLVDAHTHTTKIGQMELMVSRGVTTTCDVAISPEVQEAFPHLNVWTSRSGAFAMTKDGKAFVESMVAQGAQYIKVVVDLPEIMMGGALMDKAVLQEIVDTAHAHGLKVAVHAISMAGVQQAVDCGADMLIHIPIGEELPAGLAQQIADHGMAVMPTLVMMKAFADSPLYGYETEDYQDAVEAVRLLRSLGVPILVATDANPGGFLPAIVHGDDLHREMQLLVEAGLTPVEVLQGATNLPAVAFGLEGVGRIAPGQPATLVLVEGRPDQTITDSTKIVQIWVNGQPILK